jgi:hypothetical protein
MQEFLTYAETRLVKRHRGTMPILLTCPHDGTEAPENVSERSEADTPSDCDDFKRGEDPGTATVTEEVAQRVFQETGLSPYVVIARFRRRFIDANREARCAFTDPGAQPFYDEYHGRIRGYAVEISRENSGRGFLFDIHGTSGVDGDPSNVFLGTGNGRTLTSGFERAQLFMRHGLHGLLTAARRPSQPLPFSPKDALYTVSPRDAAATEIRRLNGGFTVRHYAERLNCIQIEIRTELRSDATRRAMLVEDLAFALMNFVRRHAPF